MSSTRSTVSDLDPCQSTFAMTFRSPDKIKILLADKKTIEIVRQACKDWWPSGLQMYAYAADGSFQLKFVGRPFQSSKLRSAIEMRSMATGILCDLYRAGWDLIWSTDLTRYGDYSTWFFRRAPSTRERPPTIVCLACSANDRLKLIGANQSIKENLKAIVQDHYGLGIQRERTYEIGGGCYEIRLKGRPWSSREGLEKLLARKTILEFIRSMNQKQFRLYATANLKGSADTMFFIHQNTVESAHDRFCLISLESRDTMQLIECATEMIDATRKSIIKAWPYGLQKETMIEIGENQKPITQFQFKRTPWSPIGSDTVLGRTFLIDFFSQLNQRGWMVAESLNLSNRINNPSTLVVRSCPPSQWPHCCMSLNEADKIRLIGVTTELVESIREAIAEHWPKGIDEIGDYFDSVQFKLNGNPWATLTTNESSLARVLIYRMLAVFNRHGWIIITSADISGKWYLGRGYDIFSRFYVHSWIMAKTETGKSSTVSESM